MLPFALLLLLYGLADALWIDGVFNAQFMHLRNVVSRCMREYLTCSIYGILAAIRRRQIANESCPSTKLCVLFRWLFSSACHLLLVVVVVFLFIRRNDRQCYCVKREHTISFQCCCKCNRFSLWAFGFLTFKTNITWMRRRLLLFRMHWADDLNKWEKMMRPRTANQEMQRRAAEGEDRWGEK